jgi:hypothetical protein
MRAKYPGLKKATRAAEKSAMDIAQGIQSPGQTKEQTRLVARGIEKGIAQFKKLHSVKERELDKALKRLERVVPEPRAPADVPSTQSVRYKQHWLPWAMLILTWLGIAGVAIWP